MNTYRNRTPSSLVRLDPLKKCFLFAVTVPYTKISKQEAYDNLEYLCSKIVVTEEKHYNGERHHHIYMRLLVKACKNQLKRFICLAYNISNQTNSVSKKNDLTKEGEIYIDSVRNEKSYINYITKYDINPLRKGIIDSEYYGFGMRAFEWAENTDSYNENDPFVLCHANYFKFLERLHATTKLQKEEHVELSEYIEADAANVTGYPSNSNVQWAQEVKQWLNNWILNGRQGKKSQLYLYGESGMGKTRYVNHLIKSCLKYQRNNPNDPDYDADKYEHQIYKPTKNDFKFAWDTFNKDIHKIIMIDEFDHADFDVNILKHALSGESFKANVKGQPGKYIKPDIPFVIMSNHPPPNENLSSKFKGFIERLIVIKAEEELYA